MAYNKHTWTTQELITSDKLNNIETGISENVSDIISLDNKIDIVSTEINVKGYGAVGDGETDDTNAILQAYSVALDNNCSVYVPYGKYLVDFIDMPDKKLFYGNGVIVNGGKQFNISSSVNRNGHSKLQNPVAITRYTHGRFDTASALSVNTNTEDEAAVTGVDDNSTGLNNYENRDSVGIFTRNTSSGWYISTTGVTFGSNYVDLKTDVDLSEVKIGMFIDTNETPKNTGIITGVVGNRITVNKWITSGGTGDGVIPTNGSIVIVNPITAIWGQNTVVKLNENTRNIGATGYELDVINNQPHRDDVNGFLLISDGNYPANSGITVRNRGKGLWNKSLESINSEYGLHHTGGGVAVYAKNTQFTALSAVNTPTVISSTNVKTSKLIHAADENNVTLFDMNNDGQMSRFILQRQRASGDVSAPIVFATGDVNLPAVDKYPNQIVIITNTTANNITINATKINVNGTTSSTKSLKPYASAMFICDGIQYYNTNFTNPFA